MIRQNRKNFPKGFIPDTSLPNRAASFKQYYNTVSVVKYRDVKDKAQGKPKVVHVLLTKHEAKMKDDQKRNADGDIIQKAEPVDYYNNKMRGVDSIDEQLHSIQILRRTYKCYLIL